MRNTAACLLAVSVVGFSADALARRTPKQVVVVRGLRSTVASVRLIPGDRVALLSVKNPPPRLLKILKGQVGSVVTGVERVDHVSGTTRVALRLSSEAFGVQLRRLKRNKGAFSLSFVPQPFVPTLSTRTLIGRVPETPPRLEWPVALPPPPKRHPCLRRKAVQKQLKQLNKRTKISVAALMLFADRIPGRECSDYFHAAVAARLMTLHRPLDGINKWAYRFSGTDRWSAHRYAYSYVALIAAGVLLRSGLVPEAEALLMTDRIQATRRLVPYRALQLADLFLARNDIATAQRLLKALFREKMSPAIRDAAGLRLIDLASKQDADAARFVLKNVVPKLPASSPFRAEAAVRAGELAIAVGDRTSARRFFNAASKSKDRNVRSHAFMRRGDLELASKSKKAVKTAHKYYDKVDRNLRCLMAMTRLRKILLDDRDRELLEQNVLEAVEDPACVGHELDARYAMSELSVTRDQFVYAMQLQKEGAKLHQDRWGIVQTFENLARKISSEAVGRLYRNRDWPTLVKLYQQHLTKRQESLSLPAMLQVSEALNRVGLHDVSASLIRSALKRSKRNDDIEELTLALAQTYLAADQPYLAEVVLDYFRRVRSRSEKLWAIEYTRAELLLRQQNGAAALGAIKNAEKSTPAGDPMVRLLFLKAEAQYQLGKANAAAQYLTKALQSDWHPPLETRGLGVNVSSLCVRECNARTLERLLKAVNKGGEGALLSERIRYLSKKRGVGRKPKLEDDSVWKRLEAVAPEIRVGPRRGKKGSR